MTRIERIATVLFATRTRAILIAVFLWVLIAVALSSLLGCAGPSWTDRDLQRLERELAR